MPENSKLVIVDDASDTPIPDSHYRFEKNAGIAVVKNKCLELLDDCEHIFLSDDDIYPIAEDWYTPYIESGINHLMFTFDQLKSGEYNGHKLINVVSGIARYSHPCGCMLYIRSRVLDVIGGFDVRYGKYSHEHVDFSNRTYNAGLTEHPYQDIYNSSDLFHSMDWAKEVVSTVKAKRARIKINDRLLAENKKSKKYYPYKPLRTAIITTFFTGIKDPQLESNWEADHTKLEKLIKSMKGQKLIIINDCFDIDNTKEVEYVKVKSNHNPYFQRWISLYYFLSENRYDQVFMVDSTDVVMLNNPFLCDLSDYLYVGDEKQIVGCKWLKENHNNDIIDPSYHSFYERYKNKTLLNAGIVGGKASIVEHFAMLMAEWYSDHKESNVYTDMPIFNYIAYTDFGKKLRHGSKINTEFKKYDIRNNTSFFRHK